MYEWNNVTILILVETLLQLYFGLCDVNNVNGHNPYFSGNSFATKEIEIEAIEDFESRSLF